MQKITPFFWFDGKAEEAANFYTSIFKNSKVVSINRWGEGSPFPKGQVMSATFELEGQQFYAFDAGPQFKFTEAISFFVNCETQMETEKTYENCGQTDDRNFIKLLGLSLYDLVASKNDCRQNRFGFSHRCRRW